MTFNPHHRSDPEAPEADVQEQQEPVEAGPDEAAEPAPVLRDPEVPEADALEQALDVPYDDEYG